MLYRKGMGEANDPLNVRMGVRAIRRELIYLDLFDGSPDTTYFRDVLVKSVRAFQTAERIHVDGIVGMETLSRLFDHRLGELAAIHEWTDWQRRNVAIESGFDPGAINVNSPASIDRGIIQLNSVANADVPEDQAWDPAASLAYHARYVQSFITMFRGYEVTVIYPDGSKHVHGEVPLGFSAWRTPVGARGLAVSKGPVMAMRHQDGGTWEQAAAYYIYRLSTTSM